MNKIVLFLVAGWVGLGISSVFAQEPTVISAEDLKPVIPQSENMEVAMSEAQVVQEGSRSGQYLGQFKKLDVSYIGSTQNCVGYDIYALKYKRSWFLAITVQDSPNLTVFIEKPPRSEEKLPKVSDFTIEGLNGILVNQYTKKKTRRKKVNDLELYGFYKLRRQGKRVAKGILYVEFPDDVNAESNFFLFKMIKGIFGKKLPKAPDPKSLKPELQKKIEAPIKEAEQKIDSAIK